MKRFSRICRRNEGSVTIEASISLVLFTSVMIMLLSIINICRVQAAIGNAINLSTIEMSQYSYFYEVTGLYSFDRNMQAIAGDASTEIGEIVLEADSTIAGVENIFTLVGNSGEVAAGTTLSSEGISDSFDSLKNNYQSGSAEINNITSSIDSLNGKFENIIKNPMDFVKGLAAMGVSGGMSAAKSHLIAAPMARALSIQHLGNGELSDNKKEDADLYLRSLGVKNGLDGLNFNLSTLFASDSPTDINIIVVYEVKFISLPFLGDFHITFAQSASTKGWLGGDETKVPPPEKEEVVENTPVTNTTPSIWGANNLVRGTYFRETLKNNNANSGIVSGDVNTMYGYYSDTNTFYKCASIDTFSASYNNDKGFAENIASNTAKKAMGKTLEKVSELSEVKIDDTTYTIDPEKPKYIECLVIIPENASAEVEKELQDYLNTYATKQNVILAKDNVITSYRLVRAGGDSPLKPQE